MRKATQNSRALLCAGTLFLASLTLTTAHAQNSLPVFDHVVVIVQENRTPDNLFGSAPASLHCNGQDDFEPGVDIQDWGYHGANH